MQTIKVIGVVGTGIMGSGIAQVAAMSGFHVQAFDMKEEFTQRARGVIAQSLAKMAAKGLLSGDPEEIAGQIEWGTDMNLFREVDYVIEAVPEVMDIKRQTLKRLDEICPARTIFASNTSQFSITSLAAATGRPDRFIGAHWFNPAVIMKLIEVVRGLDTSEETLAVTLELCRVFGKETVVCRKDTAGFITTRMLSLWGNEALRILEEGIATVEDIDKACRFGFGHPMGPFEINDFSGLDTSLRVRENLFAAYGDRYRPGATLRNLVNAGHLGRKTGRGYYRYGDR